MGQLQLRSPSSGRRERRVSASVLHRSGGCEGGRVQRLASQRDRDRSIGRPFTVNLGVDQANIGAGPAQRQLRDPNLARGERTPDRWFDSAAFELPVPFTFGNAPRNSVLGPGLANIDFALAKTWNIAAGSQLEFRWEVFNLLNRANFDLPNRIFGTPNFGRIFSARNPREMQFGLRLAF
jgi:hypothetical protein